MLIELKERLLSNSFVDKVRTHLNFDDEEYQQLRIALIELAKSLQGSSVIDRELMLYLYSAPMIVRNSYESYPEKSDKIAQQLEDAWIELDRLVLECLVD
jgi:hypothetical protein